MDGVDGPPSDALETVFYVRDTDTDGDRIRYYGEPLVPRSSLADELSEPFRRAGYRVDLEAGREPYETVVVATPADGRIDGVPGTNLALFVATVVSTLLVGAVAWYYIPPADIAANPLLALRAWPFTAAVLGVLTAHELGHYLAGRYHRVDVSLPYLIPFVVPFGTLGAIIRMRGQMPDRKTLFDIGVAGPLAGLAATVVVTAIGLSLDPMTIPPDVLDSSAQVIVFNNPPLLDLIATALGQPTSYADPTKTVHPVIIGGWVGMFFTVLNLLPVDQAVDAVADDDAERRELSTFFGEDFELVFTGPRAVVEANRESLDTPITRIGRVTDDGVLADGDPLPDRGYTH